MSKNTVPPIAEIRAVSDTRHGITRSDNYAWLRADNWQEVMRDPSVLATDIRDYLEAENTYCTAQMADTEALQDTIYGEIRGRMKEDDASVPLNDGAFAYGHRMLTGKQYPVLFRTPRGGGDEEVLLDCNIEAGEDYFGFAGGAHSPDHALLRWSADTNGSEYYTIRVRDLATGKDLADEITQASGGGAWTADSSHFYYVKQDENHRPFQVYRHKIGDAQSDDVLVYEEADAGFFVNVGKQLSGNHIVITASDHTTSEEHFLDAHDTQAKPFCIQPRIADLEYDSTERDGILYIRTNADGAQDYKIVTAKLGAHGMDQWQDLLPYRPGCLVLSVMALKDYLIRLERKNGLPRIVIRDFATDKETEIAFPEEAYGLGLGGVYEFDSTTIRFSYASPTTPSQQYDYDLASGKRTLLKTQEIPSGHEPSDYVARRVFADSADGETVPVTLLYHKDTKLDGSAPCLLYGYGSYGMAMPADFSLSNRSLVDRGFVYAIAHIRGGMEKGYHWYTDGKLEKKTNTFKDFITVADMLCAENFTSKGNIVAQGGSAGGMLMGAIANMAPDRFAGIIAQVPFVDVLNTMLDDTLPLTPPEWPEWGNPIDSKQDYQTIAAYSPYDQTCAQAYPSMLVMGGLTDPRVTYWEPAKWVAKLRAVKTDDNLLVLKTNMDAGHGGASGRFDRIKETALAYAFAVQAVGKS